MSSGGSSKAPLFFFIILAALLPLQTGCATFRGKQYPHFSTSTPLKSDQTLVLAPTLHKNRVYFDFGSKLPFALPPRSTEDLCEQQRLRSWSVSVVPGVV
jgi:hypothetical protein